MTSELGRLRAQYRAEVDKPNRDDWLPSAPPYIEALEVEVERLSADNIDPENIHFVMSHPEAVARQMTRDTERIKSLEAEVTELRSVVERLTRERNDYRNVRNLARDEVYRLRDENTVMAQEISNLNRWIERLEEELAGEDQ